MPIERFLSIDLQTDAVCDFLRDHANPRYDAGFDSETWMAQGDYEDSGIRKELPNTDDETRNIRLHTAILKNYEIYDRQTQMQVAIGKAVTRVDHPLTLSLYALLLVRKRIDTMQRAAIEQAFQRYQPGIDDVDAVETALLIFEAAKGSAPLCRKRSMRPKGTTIQLEVRRRVAVSLLEAGWGVRHVARHGPRLQTPSWRQSTPPEPRLTATAHRTLEPGCSRPWLPK